MEMQILMCVKCVLNHLQLQCFFHVSIFVITSQESAEFSRMKMRDMISEFPDDLLHNLLFLIPKEEAARASILSRHRRSVLSSFPVMIFGQSAIERDENVFSENIKKMERDLYDFVDCVIHRRRECSVQTLEITI